MMDEAKNAAVQTQTVRVGDRVCFFLPLFLFPVVSSFISFSVMLPIIRFPTL